MRFGSIDVPLRLLAARRSGRLVIFAGAGVSRLAPSCLPDFAALVKEIAGNKASLQGNDPPDRFLGRLAHAGIPVHEKAARLLSRPDSEPNELHRLLVQVFPRPEELRLVTTNFDPHFEAELAARFPLRPPIYAAPALPVGGRFSGLAYVHGRLGSDPKDLVLTDGDFGRAYLTEGWARRFLAEVFAAFDVLFVGYSHQDAIVSYLARGLPPTGDQKRYALTPRSETEHWQLLDITPLEYEEADDHVALRVALREWLDLEERGALGHQRKVRELVERPPDALREPDEEYLLDFCLPDPKLAHFFYRYALDPGWLRWAAARSRLAPLFAASEDEEEAQDLVAAWFARESLSARGAVALELAQTVRRLPRRLWEVIAMRVGQALDMQDLPEAAAESAAQWLSLLERHGGAASDYERIGHWLKQLSPEAHTFLAVQIFTYLTRPIGISEPSLERSAGGELVWERRPAVRIRADRYWFREYWTTRFLPNLHLFARHLAPVAFAHLQQAHFLLRSEGAVQEGLDRLSLARTAIEPHAQNEHPSPDAFGVFIDAARDILDWLIREEPETARCYIEVGFAAASPLVRRLCIYGLAQHPRIPASRKIATAIEQNWLRDISLHHETFLLLQAAYKGCSTRVRRRLIRAAERVYFSRERATDDSAQDAIANAWNFANLLEWLQQSDPDCPLIAKALGALRRRHGDLPVREHPDLLGWSSGVQTVQTVSPLPLEEVLKLEPPAWVEAFARIAQLQWEPGENPAVGFLQETEKAAAQDLGWGLCLAEHLATEQHWDHRIWHYLLRCWAGAPLEAARWTQVITFLGRHREIWQHAAEVTDVLYRSMARRELAATAEMVVEGFRLAEALWATLGRGTEEELGGAKDWMQLSLNRAGGSLVLYCDAAVSRLHEIEAQDWRGMPSTYRSFLTRIAEAPSGSSTLGRVVLCNRLAHWFDIDPQWTRATLFPLFDWNRDRLAAEQAWHGLLRGKLTRELLADFMPFIERTFAHLADLGQVRMRFSQYLAMIAHGSEADPLAGGWIEDFMRLAEPADRREWTQAIRSLLGDLTQEERRQLWDAWLRRYLELRLEWGIPVADDEWAEVIHWSLPLAGVLPEMVQVVTKRQPGRASRDTILYHQLKESSDMVKHPEALADLLIYLLAAEGQRFHDCEYVADIVRKLLDVGASRGKLRALAQRLAELGCDDAQELADRIDRAAA
jgi:Domain of unknown function (DUF4020)/SIR2-like domain